MKDIDVAIAIVTYKSADFAIDCLRSIAAERSATPSLTIRAIIVDNASGDAPPVARAIETNGWSSWVTLIEAPRNGGFAYGNNMALQHAYGDKPSEYFLLLNPDTRVAKGAIEVLVRFLEAHPQAGIAGSRLENPDGEIGAFRFPSVLSELEFGLKFRLASLVLQPWTVTLDPSPTPQQVDWVGGASMMIRRDVIESIGGMDENYFLYFEETDFCFRAKKAGFSTWYVPESRVVHFDGQSTKAVLVEPRRLPSYWFESRRRYFVTTYGMPYAIMTDAVALAAHGLGNLKRIARRRAEFHAPNFLSDLARHSLLWPGNRNLLAIKHFMPKPKLLPNPHLR